MTGPYSGADKRFLALACLDEPGEICQCHPRTRLIIGDRHYIGNSFVHDEDLGATGCFSERRRHRHLAAKLRISCLELERFDYLPIWDKLHEVTMICIGVRC